MEQPYVVLNHFIPVIFSTSVWNIKQIILREDSKQTKPVLEVVDKGLPAVLTPEDKHKFQVPVDLVNYYHPTFVELDC